MSPDKVDLDQFFKETDAVAVVSPAADLFSLLSRKLQLPPDLAALVTRKAGDRILTAPGGEVAGDDVTEVMFVRIAPLELSFERAGLATKGDYLCQAAVTFSVSVVPERGEAESFRSAVLGSRRVVRLPAIAQYLEPVVAGALAALVEQHEVEDLVDGKCGDEAVGAIRQAVATPCFQAGLAVSGNVVVRFESEGLREVRAKDALTARRLDEHAAQQQLNAALSEARTRHLDDLGTTLQRLQGLAAESPDAALPDLLRTFSESERAKLYEALFESQAVTSATKWLVVASGHELLFFAPDSFDAPARRVTLEGEIGPLRSIQGATLPSGERRLLAGSARGVYELGVDASAVETAYSAAPPGEVRGGVNAVAALGDEIFATHSELGLLRWDRAKPDSATPCCVDIARDAKTVRSVCVAQDRIFFGVDDRVVSFAPDDESDRRVYTGSASAITAVLARGSNLFAGNADGQVLHWPEGETSAPRVLHGGSRRPVASVALMVSGGVSRLFYTDTTLAVFARVLGDTFTCRYEAGGQTLQRVEVAPDLVVATDDPRHRLLIWRPNRTDRPIAAIHIPEITHHSIQDVTLLPMEA